MKPKLGRVRPEQVQRLVQVEGAPNPIGERAKTWQPVWPLVTATVTPVSAEQAHRAGLIRPVERLQVRWPAGTAIQSGDRVIVRTRTWSVVQVQRWSSFVLTTVEVI